MSDNPAAPEELRQLFRYIQERGVTPELMESLRRFGNKVKYRPDTTADPTDGDLEFWHSTLDSSESTKPQKDARPVVSPPKSNPLGEAEQQLAAAQERYQGARREMVMTVLGFLWLIVIAIAWLLGD